MPVQQNDEHMQELIKKNLIILEHIVVGRFVIHVRE